MFSIVKRFNRHITTIKKIKPNINKPKPKPKHKYDVENESWTEPKKQDVYYIYKVLKVEKKEILLDEKTKIKKD
tara:strand:- start:188 stop:409 length:222 start_codon:yes stop_codon:yes gene_type:complete